MDEIVKHINDTNASYRQLGAGDAKNTDLFLDSEQYKLFENSGEHITVRYNKENLSMAILFIASILPRKFDNSANHTTISYSKGFVIRELQKLDGFFTVKGESVSTRTQTWNVRKDILKRSGKTDSRFYFNGLFEIYTFKDEHGASQSAKFTIRDYLAGGYSDIHIKKIENGVFNVWVTNALKPDFNEEKDTEEEITDSNMYPADNFPRQVIYYGAPGTGKSYTIKRETKDKHVIRTTFHPDSDYSTFVGAYKPITTQVPRYISLGDKAIELKDSMGKPIMESRIEYEFVEQAFLQAYVNAWKLYAASSDGKNAESQYLVIEEINRGNCAQIFGDLFQLLDRKDNGFSEYPITADTDMRNHLAKVFKDIEIPNVDMIDSMYDGGSITEKIKKGEVLLVPGNLYILATMNTSDQSLFPIDSAFKRRWEWKYVPISKGVDKETNTELNWRIQVNGSYYDWWSFLEKINEQIGSLTSRQDKKLGFFFCKARNGIITAEQFVDKVLFFIWNEVLKDYEKEQDFLEDGGSGNYLTFDQFYGVDANGKTVINEEKAEVLLSNLGLKRIQVGENVPADTDE